MSKQTTVDGYIRVSVRRGREGPGYISIPVQREAIERWAEYKGVTIAMWHVDEDESGGTHDRPGLEAAVARCVDGDTGGIVSWKIDRFSRYTEGGLRDLRRLEDRGARLAFVVEDVDTSGPMGKFVYTVMLAMGEYFLDNIKAGWVTAKTRAMARGAKVGPTPVGYDRLPDSRLEPHPVEAPHVEHAFVLAVDRGVPAAVRYLAEHLPVRLTGKHAGEPRTWTPRAVRKMLGNPAYLGEVQYGDLPGKVGAHKPLVSRVLWLRAQHPPVARRQTAEPFPLTGVLRCDTCGGRMVGGHGGKDRRRTYRCGSASRGDRCDARMVVSADIAESFVLRELGQSWPERAWRVGESPTADLDALTRAVDEADDEIQRFADNPTAAKALTPAGWDRALASRVAERDRAVAELDAQIRQKPQRTRTPKEGDWATLGLDDLREFEDALTVTVGRGRGDARFNLVWTREGLGEPVTAA